jgi:hypothetical protein
MVDSAAMLGWGVAESTIWAGGSTRSTTAWTASAATGPATGSGRTVSAACVPASWMGCGRAGALGGGDVAGGGGAAG